VDCSVDAVGGDSETDASDPDDPDNDTVYIDPVDEVDASDFEPDGPCEECMLEACPTDLLTCAQLPACDEAMNCALACSFECVDGCLETLQAEAVEDPRALDALQAFVGVMSCIASDECMACLSE
jgi:hypothetical protein